MKITEKTTFLTTARVSGLLTTNDCLTSISPTNCRFARRYLKYIYAWHLIIPL